MAAGKKILHVEDNLENRILIRRLLMSENYEVLEAENARQAINILASTTPNMILMDINMPDIDGYSLTANLKSRPNLNKVPIVAITANVMRGDGNGFSNQVVMDILKNRSMSTSSWIKSLIL